MPIYPEIYWSVLVDKVGHNINHFTPKGIFIPRILCGKLGADARAIGGALLPFTPIFHRIKP